MSHEIENVETDHAYDGISEYDNPLPGWWKWLFILSAIFTVIYIMYYHMGPGPDLEAKYQASVASHVEAQLALLGDLEADNNTIVKFMSNDEWMSAMGGLFRGNCSQCHASDGGGNVGPNLCDDSYKNVKTPEDIYTVIEQGIAGTQMTAWSDRFQKPQLILLSAYVGSLRGTSPASPKEAEGVEIAPWPEPLPDAASEAPAADVDTAMP
ncbi:MAG: cbb3-type cytochrome c oxidase N-terminal domain-containing protein [Planctomycetota bacterium]